MIKATLTLANKKNPVISGYRPLFYINGGFYSGVITFEDNVAYPYEEKNVTIEFITYNGILNSGDEIRVFESPKHEVGKVIILGP